jgi:excisionase family DNA binding protein
MAADVLTELITVAEAARILGLSAGHLHRISARGLVRHFIIGHRRKFLREDLAAYIESCAVEARPMPMPAPAIRPAPPGRGTMDVALRYLKPQR